MEMRTTEAFKAEMEKDWKPVDRACHVWRGYRQVIEKVGKDDRRN